MNTNFQLSSDIENGFYTIVYPSGEHRTLRVKTPRNGNFAGKKMVGFLSGCNNESDYTFFAFIVGANLKFWRNFANSAGETKVTRMASAVSKIAADLTGTGLAYALRSGNCFRCNRLLTNPESILTGLGPDCAGRR